MNKRCRHSRKREHVRPFTGPVKHPQNRVAHGGYCLLEVCETCGSERRTNLNQGAVERGRWIGQDEFRYEQ